MSMLNQKNAEPLILSLVISHLDYANAILVGLPENTMKKLQRIQKIAAKLVMEDKRNNSNFENVKTLHWLPVRLQIDLKILFIYA